MADEINELPHVRANPRDCEICGVPWVQHPRCRACTIGLGEGHLEGPGVLLGDVSYCGDCAARQLKEQPIRERISAGERPASRQG